MMKSKLIIEIETSDMNKVVNEDGDDITEDTERDLHREMIDFIDGLISENEDIEYEVMNSLDINGYDNFHQLGNIRITISEETKNE